MRARLRLIIVSCAVWGATWSGSASADTGACTNDPPGSGSPVYTTCLFVSNTSPEVNEPVTIRARLVNYIVPIATSFTLYDGNFARLTQATSAVPADEGYMIVNMVFTSPGTVQMRADPSAQGRLDSPTIPITVRRFAPRYSLSIGPSPAHAGDTLQFNTTTTFYRPQGGTLVWYMVPPGGSVLTPIQIRRKTVATSAANSINDVDQSSMTLAAPYNTPGEYIFYVGYLGDANNAESGSAYVKVRVGPHPTATSLSQSAAESLSGKAVTLTATVTPATGAIAAPSGNVEFYDGTTLLGTAAIDAGSAVLATTGLRTVGDRPLTARYVGDSWNLASTSAPLTHTTKIDPATLVPIIDLALK